MEFLYATDRAYAPEQPGLVPYSSERGVELRVGKARVQLGRPDHTWEEIQVASRSESKRGRPRVELASVSDQGPLWTFHPELKDLDTPAPSANGNPDPLASEIERLLSQTSRKEVFIFVHGYKNGFKDSMEVAAELFHYLGREGVFLSYAWPSDDSLKAYFVDKLSSMYSARNFRFLLSRIARTTSAEKIHIIAHSAGTSLAAYALRDLRILYREKSAEELHDLFKLENVVLAAPDMDIMLFGQAVHDGYLDMAKRTTVYGSRGDKALGMSSWLFKTSRVGNPFAAMSSSQLEKLRTTQGIFLVDATTAQQEYGGWLGHSYFYENPWVFSDIILLLKQGRPPAERGLIAQETGAYWAFPEDYPARLAQLAAGGSPTSTRSSR